MHQVGKFKNNSSKCQNQPHTVCLSMCKTATFWGNGGETAN